MSPLEPRIHPTLVHLLRHQADVLGDAPFTRFLLTGDAAGPSSTCSFAELDRRARRVAAHLQTLTRPGDRALLVFPPGDHYIAGFFGCLMAGVVAVPAYPPDPTRLDRTLPRLRAIAEDAGASVALAPDFLCKMAAGLVAMEPKLAALPWVATDSVPEGAEDGWTRPEVGPEDLAFLQYTSGSTGEPKGVMVTHGNLVVNAAASYRVFRNHRASRGVIWLPAYHDMGLIGGIVQPLFGGFEVALMSPLDFLRRPVRWLDAIHTFRGTVTGAPDFALQLAVRKATDADVARLDLSCLEVLFTGAEPVRAESLRAFEARFAPCGLRKDVLYPTYGLAEATLQVSGYTTPARRPIVLSVDREELQQHRVVPASEGQRQELVACGPALDEHELRIVDPETRERRGDGAVGEIWFRGPSVAKGYWANPEATARTFQARAADGSGPWLRTGDLGLLHDGELYITGRLKDLIISRGRNVYPHDLERCALAAHPRLRPGGTAAFGVERGCQEQVVLVAEVDDRGEGFDPQAIVDAMRRALMAEQAVEAWGIALLKRGGLPKTSSGKLQRHACRRSYEEGGLDELFRHELPVLTEPEPPAAAPDDLPAAIGALCELAAAALGRRPEDIDPTAPLQSFGLDSVRVIELVTQAETLFERRIDPDLVYRTPTLEALAQVLMDDLEAAAADDAREASAYAAAPTDEPIAIVGMACRFPGGATSPEALWRMLLDGRDPITEVPPDRWDIEAWYDPDVRAPNKMATRWGGFMDGIRDFEPGFFGITPKEARNVDPQHRMLLETTWEALEDAGLPPGELRGTNAGVYVGIASSDYSHRDVPTNAYTGTGSAFSVAAGRISYTFGFEGPSLCVDTACSSSLVAVHLACQALRLGEADLALAGGANATLHPEMVVFLSQMRALSPTGRCRSFDAHADGYVRSDGCGLVVLKRLSDARRDGDRVLALVTGSAVNQDGESTGLTAPNGRAQEAVQRSALSRAGLRPDDLDYLEAHGTGTPLGDPIEIQAIGAVHAGRAEPLPVGSIKSVIGHTEGAAGIAGLIKATLAVREGRVPGNLHFQRPNPHIPWQDLPVEVVATERRFGRADHPRRAGVSAFGFSGTNAHLIVEQAPTAIADDCPETRPVHPLVLSAASPAALRAQAGRLADLFEGLDDTALGDACHTLAIGREPLSHRFACMVGSSAQAAERLRSLAQDTEDREPSGSPRMALLFTGQGAQHPVMARELYDTQPVFRGLVDELAREMDPHLERPLLELLFEPEAPIGQTVHTQPVLFALELALAELWRSWGVEAEVVVGHSVGEIAAACYAGVLDRADAARLVTTRARRMQELPAGGAMVAVAADELDVAAHLEGAQSAIAAVNAPGQVVIAGPEAEILAASGRLERNGHPASRLDVSHAFHSPLMDPALADLAAQTEAMVHHPARVPMVLSCADTAMGPAYWPAQARGCVRFSDAVHSLVDLGVDTLVEVGPQPVLLGLAGQGAARGALRLPSLRRGHSDWQVLGTSLCRLWEAGARVDWAAFDAPYALQRRAMPGVLFQRKPYWLDEIEHLAVRGTSADHPLLGSRLDLAGARIWEISLSTSRWPWLADHRVAGRVVVPATAWLELFWAAGQALSQGSDTPLASVRIERPLTLDEGKALRVQVSACEEHGATVLSAHVRGADGAWVRHARAEVGSRPEGRRLDVAPEAPECVDVAGAYAAFEEVGLDYGPSFRSLRSLATGRDGVVAQAALPEALWSEAAQLAMHPALLDGALQAVAPLLDGELHLPVGVEGLQVHRPGAHAAEVWARRSEPRGDEPRFDLVLVDGAGQPVAEIAGLALRPADPSTWGAGPGTASAAALALALEQVPVPPSEGYGELDGSWRIVGDGPVAQRVRLRLTASGETRRGAVFLWEGEGSVTQACLALARLAGQLGEEDAGQLLVGTRCDAVEAAALAGFVRTLAQEAPALAPRTVVLDAEASVADAARQVVHEAKRLDREEQVAWVDGERLAPRLVPAASGRLTAPDSADWHLVQEERGALDSLALAPRERRSPGPGEVELAVEACGLNFRDVLNALGAYPGPPGPLGGECAGHVVAVGSGVTHLELGDPVMALLPAAFGRFATVDARMVVRRPRGLSAEQAATVPVAFTTALYALRDLAGLEAGERVLVHAAAGGVGMAAVQLARAWGAEVLGTASEGKRAVARDNGAHQVFDSRSTSFAPAIEQVTDGQGVDVVLNAFTGDLLRAGFEVLAAHGRFIELGKAELLDPVEVLELHPTATYRPFDLAVAEPAVLHELLTTVARGLEDGTLRPLPHKVFGLDEAVSAFRFMAQARHVGKVVLTPTATPFQVSPSGTVLVTGAFGGLGRHICRWLVDQGARHLVLTASRPLDEEREAFVASLSPAAVGVEVVDLADPAAVEATVAGLRDGEQPLRGVVHAAGVLADALVADLDAASLRRVWAPKVGAARALDVATRGHPLDFFVLFSSLAGVLGNAGQAAYAAANAALDGLARARQAAGEPAVSVAWGLWAGDGMASGLTPRERHRLAARGLGLLEPEEALRWLEQALRQERPTLVVAAMDRDRLARATAGRAPALLSELLGHDEGDTSLREELEEVAPADRPARLLLRLRESTAKVMGAGSIDVVDPERSLREQGLDSLMAVDLHGELCRQLRASLPETMLLDHPDLVALTDALLDHLDLGTRPMEDLGSPAAGPSPDSLLERELAELEEMLT